MNSIPKMSRSFWTRRFGAVAVVASAALLVASACAIQESNTYPIETFSEMHYSQAARSQEPPRLPPVQGAIAFNGIGTENRLDVPDVRERPYEPDRARELFRVNCSVCHGTAGEGNGPAAEHLTATDSYYYAINDEAYAAPANLKTKRDEYDKQAMVNIITNGIIVMPRFGNLLAEEDIREIATYIYDEQSGIGP